jgi:hypothetical protein
MQFQSRKELYTGKRFSSISANVTKYGDKLFGSTNMNENPSLNEPSTLSVINSTRFRGLDFLYHIGSFDAVQLQRQIVDFLEFFFRNGRSAPEAASQKSQFINTPHLRLIHNNAGSNVSADQIGDESFQNPALSLREMAEVLQSIELIHSSSAPIFFSEFRASLVDKWEGLLKSTQDRKALLESVVKTNELSQDDILGEKQWFRALIDSFISDYTLYLEHLGMERATSEALVKEPGQFGGAFAASSGILIEAPSVLPSNEKVFMIRYFPHGSAILVQLGYYDFFATINVLTFTTDTDLGHENAEFLTECSNMKTLSHIVSCNNL